MKILIVIGTLLVLAGATLTSSANVSGTWIVTTGIILLLGASAIFVKEKSWGKWIFSLPVILMLVLFLGNSVNGMWYAHPLGAIISIIGGGWVIFRIMMGKKNEREISREPLIRNFFQKLLPNIKQHIRWVGVPLSILIALWLSKSILIAFIVGFGIATFLDKQSIRTKGINRVAVILLLYTVGFCILIIGTYKITNPYSGIFYNMGEVFFDGDIEGFLYNITRGL